MIKHVIIEAGVWFQGALLYDDKTCDHRSRGVVFHMCHSGLTYQQSIEHNFKLSPVQRLNFMHTRKQERYHLLDNASP